MKKTPKPSKTAQQQNLIEPSIEIDFFKLLAESKLSENEQGIVKRRLLENREQFGKLMQCLVKVHKITKPTQLPYSTTALHVT